MREIVVTGQYKKDVKLLKKRGKELSKLKVIVEDIYHGRPLQPKHRDHMLVGNYRGRRECHVEPDWLLIYRVFENCILLERTGSHSDLFK